jgi:hypothetical protein
MAEVEFRMVPDLTSVARAQKLSDLDWELLSATCRGDIVILFSDPRDYIILSTYMLGSMVNLFHAVSHLVEGKTEASMIAGDYFSNHVHFTHQRKSGTLLLQFGNVGGHIISTSFDQFHSCLFDFLISSFHNLELLYPDLKHCESISEIRSTLVKSRRKNR